MKFKIILGIMAICMMSCSTYKKKLAKATQFFNEHPEVGAEYCADKYPPRVEYVKGKTDTIPGETITVKGDSIPCPDGTKAKAPDKRVNCPPSTNTVDTIRIENTARVVTLQNELKARGDTIIILSTQIQDKDKKIKEAEGKAEKRLYFIVGLLVVIGGGIIAKFKGLI